MPPSIDVEADDDASIGDQRAVSARVVADLKAAFDHGHSSLSVRQNGHHLRLIDQLGRGTPMWTSTIIASSGWPSAGAIDNELCQSASRRARQAALVGSAPRMSVPMPISSTIRFFVIVLPSGCCRAQKYQGRSDRTTIFAQHAAFEARANSRSRSR